MTIRYTPALFISILLLHSSAAQDVIPLRLPASCEELNRKVLTQTAAGRANEAEEELSAMLTQNIIGVGPACAGLSLGNLAALMEVSGRFVEAERFAERAVTILEGVAGPKSAALLRPLQILASARLEQGKVGSARQAFQKMQTIPDDRPDSRALVHGLGAILLETEGNSTEAEGEYRETLNALEQAGRGNTADAASGLLYLGGLYIKDGHLNDAAAMLDRALLVFDAAADTVPFDRIKLLNLRAVLHARQADWQKAEVDLRSATSLADKQPGFDPWTCPRS
jgi:tetratricopeptide (TPR) repeat protein